VLTQIDLQHFKCFERLSLPLTELTVLSGANSSGKSSVLQALVLLHQTMREHEWSTRLMLNGSAIQLGTVLDVVDQIHGRRSLEIGLSDDERDYRWTFVGERSEMSMAVERVMKGHETFDQPKWLRHLLPLKMEGWCSLPGRLYRLSYLTAERVGPRQVYALEDPQSATVVGPTGERTASVLHWGRDEPVLPELVLAGRPNTRLHQVEARMWTFFPNCSLSLQPVPQANAVTLGLRTSDDTDFHRPVHVGFGLTQVLPIVVAALSAGKGDLLLIENPEVHLHPAGQGRMGQFLADVARAGVQVIIETHSDHILNGIRRAVKTGRLAPEQTALYFFRPRTSEMAQVDNPILDASGNIDVWPEGFFDQFDKDMNYFAGWGE